MFARQVKALDMGLVCVLLAAQLEASNQSLNNGFLERKPGELEQEHLLLELEVQRAVLETVINNAPVGIILYDPDMRVLGVNAEYARLAPSGTRQLRGQLAREIVPDPIVSNHIHRRVLAGGKSNVLEVTFGF